MHTYIQVHIVSMHVYQIVLLQLFTCVYVASMCVSVYVICIKKNIASFWYVCVCVVILKLYA